jgi:hypothetical protein
MSVALSKPPGKRDARHLMRYLKAKGGMDVAAIAKAEHVSLSTVKDSIESIQRYENQNSEGQLQLAVRDLVISTIPQAKETLNGLLTATEVVMKKNLKTGKDEYVTVEDKTTRLEGTRLVRDLVIGMQPKGPGVVVNANQTNQTANIGSAETYEERLRRLREKVKEFNLLPAEVTAVPDSIDAPDNDDDGDDDDDDKDGYE